MIGERPWYGVVGSYFTASMNVPQAAALDSMAPPARLVVSRTSTAVIVPAASVTLTDRGRGILLTEVLSTHWGAYPSDTGGKVVFSVIAGSDASHDLPDRVPQGLGDLG